MDIRRINMLFFITFAVMLFAGTGSTWALSTSEVAKLLAGDGGVNDQFGTSVSVDGDTAVIGAPFDDGSSGSTYVFTRSGSTWTQQAKLKATDMAGGDNFGISVAVSGNTAVVGANQDDDAGSNSGSAYVFTRSGSTWTQQAKLKAGDGAANDFFGSSVSVSGDTAVVGARFDDDKGINSGSAYVFTRSGSTWTQQTKLTASDGAVNDQFGTSVSVDGDTAVIGVPFDDSSSGSTYVFTRSRSTWTQQAKLTATDMAGGDNFGISVAVSGDTAVVGARFDDDAGSASGSAYVFSRSGIVWTQQAKLTAGDGAASDFFGSSVSVSGDTAVVGADQDDAAGTNSGSAYVFTRSGTMWTQQAKLTAGDGTAFDLFGSSVSVSGDTTVVGANQDDAAGSNSGSAYVFSPTPVVEVNIDIKPGSDPNCFNINGHGVIPVAILGSSEFAVNYIDVYSLSFAGLEVRNRGNRGPLCSFEYVNEDVFLDMVCHFDDNPDSWLPGDDVAELSGELLDGTEFKGTDSICVVN